MKNGVPETAPSMRATCALCTALRVAVGDAPQAAPLSPPLPDPPPRLACFLVTRRHIHPWTGRSHVSNLPRPRGAFRAREGAARVRPNVEGCRTSPPSLAEDRKSV